jgi:sugar lactone lactonase YvrE
MPKKILLTAMSLVALSSPAPIAAQQNAPLQQPFAAGGPLGVTVQGQFTPISSNVRVLGSFRFAESCTYDTSRNLIVAMNRGIGRNEAANDGYVSLLNPDGTVHTTKWIGVNRNGLTLEDPLGSALQGGVLYAADVDHVRKFNIVTGEPMGAFQVMGATGLNGIAVAQDGTIYATNTGNPQRVYRITPDGAASVFVDGAPLSSPNGIAVDPQGNIVVVNLGDDNVLTFSPAGQLIRTEQTAQPGNDGLVIMPDGTKYISSVQRGGIARLRPGQQAELIAQGIPSAASMCYDPVQRQLIIPMNNHNAMAFIRLEN